VRLRQKKVALGNRDLIGPFATVRIFPWISFRMAVDQGCFACQCSCARRRKHGAQTLSVEATRTIVAIHGVGSPAIGDIAKEVIGGFDQSDRRQVWETIDKAHRNPELYKDRPGAGGTHKYKLVTIGKPGQEVRILEINWSDLKQFPKSPWGVPLFALKMLLAMVQVTAMGYGKTQRGVGAPLKAGSLLRAYFGAFSITLPICVAIITFSDAIQATWLALVLAVAFALVAIAAQFFLVKLEGWMAAGYLVVAVATIAGLCIALDFGPRQQIVETGYAAIGYLELAVGPILGLALAELLWQFLRSRSRTRDTWTQFATRAALMVLPVALVTAGYGAVVNAFTFTILERAGLLSPDLVIPRDILNANYLRGIGYSVAFLELVNGWVTFIVGWYFFFGIGFWFLMSKFAWNKPWKVGLRLQDTFATGVWLIVAGFIVVGIATTVDLINSGRTRQCALGFLCWMAYIDPERELSAAEIYRRSALRLFPWLMFILTSLQVFLSVAADVLFYVLPRGPLAMGKHVRDRIKSGLDSVADEPNVTVVAYSQGTIPTYEIMASDPQRPRYIMVGSPWGSLYGRFLNVWPEPNAGSAVWLNVFRPSDYIGGALSNATDYVFGESYPQGHLAYFEEKTILKLAHPD
jgi:hypothetical protein